MLWQAYFANTDVHTATAKHLKLNRPDVGWYQVRKALQSRNTSGDFTTVSEALTEKLRPMVYELGFLRA
jgi:hypothetical protein